MTLFRLERWLTECSSFLRGTSGACFQSYKESTYRSRLSLSNQVPAKNGGPNGSLLNSRRLFETVSIDTTKEFFGEFHFVKGLNGFIPVRINVGISQAAGGSFVSASIMRRLFTVVEKEKEVSTLQVGSFGTI